MEEKKVVRVMLVDDHPAIRRGLSVYLELHDDFSLVGEAMNGVDAIKMIDTIRPDVILMDIHMPGMDGITATRLIHQSYPNVKIIALTNYFEEKVIDDILAVGASDFIIKDVSIDDLTAKIREAIRQIDEH